MDPRFFILNIRSSWRHRGDATSFVKRLLWTYSQSRMPVFCPAELELEQRYSEPIGRIRLLVRANNGSDGFIFGEVFDHEYYRLDLPFSPATILDLGANAGFTAVYFSRIYPSAEIAAVEPVPENVRILRRNLELNAPRVKAFAAAVTVEDGPITMELATKDYGHKVAGAVAAAGANHVQVEGLSITTILGRLRWERVGLLKVDIEGYESTLFSGDCAWLLRVDSMCIECHEGFGEGELSQLARRFGFQAPKRLAGVWLLRR